MEFAPAGVPLSFEVTFDSPSLHVAMTVYDDTGSSPVLLLSPFAMVRVYGNTYRAKFTAANGKNYIVVKSVYTDNTYATLDDGYAAGSESVVAQYFGSGSQPSACPIIGIVEPNNTVIGIVEC